MRVFQGKLIYRLRGRLNDEQLKIAVTPPGRVVSLWCVLRPWLCHCLCGAMWLAEVGGPERVDAVHAWLCIDSPPGSLTESYDAELAHVAVGHLDVSICRVSPTITPYLPCRE